MLDRLLSSALRFTIVSLTGAVAAGALALCYWGLLQALQGKVVAGPIGLAIGTAMAFGAWLMARNRNDLADC
jgi:hypothetical protein